MSEQLALSTRHTDAQLTTLQGVRTPLQLTQQSSPGVWGDWLLMSPCPCSVLCWLVCVVAGCLHHHTIRRHVRGSLELRCFTSSRRATTSRVWWGKQGTTDTSSSSALWHVPCKLGAAVERVSQHETESVNVVRGCGRRQSFTHIICLMLAARRGAGVEAVACMLQMQPCPLPHPCLWLAGVWMLSDVSCRVACGDLQVRPHHQHRRHSSSRLQATSHTEVNMRRVLPGCFCCCCCSRHCSCLKTHHLC